MLADQGSLNSYRTNCDVMTNGYSTSNSSTNSGLSPQPLDVLLEFLKEADLEQYFDELSNKLKVRSINHLKYVDDTDLQDIGMTRPEMRRLKRFFEKECPQTAMGKIKKKLSRNASTRSVSVPRPQDFVNSRANSYCVRGIAENGYSRPDYGRCSIPPGCNGRNTIKSSSPLSVSEQTNGSDDQTTIGSITNFSISSSNPSNSDSGSAVINNSLDIRYAMATGNQYILPANNVVLDELMTKGYFAEIYKGQLKSNSTTSAVAVKVIDKKLIKSDMNEFIRETFINCFLEHTNLARLHGICLNDDTIKLVSELSHMGCCLTERLTDLSAKVAYPVPKLHSFIVQISQAMTYLEEHRIIHGNLCGRNVILFSNDQIKLTDAGLYRIHNKENYESNTLTRNIGNQNQLQHHQSIRCAPELARGTNNRTLSSDVWSFGQLCWQIFNYGQSMPENINGSIENDERNNIFITSQPEFCPTMIYQIILTCWTAEPSNRPSFFQLSTQIVRIHPERLIALINGPDQVPNSNSKSDDASDGSYSSLPDVQMLDYSKNDVIIVLDRSMSQYRDYWKGCLLDGSVGLFRWANMRAEGVDISKPKGANLSSVATNPKSPVMVRAQSLSRGVGEAFSKLRMSRRESDVTNTNKKSTMSTGSANKHRGRLSAHMISAPSNDFRHIGHVGCKGDVFGDVTSLYTTTAQENIKSGILTVNCRMKTNSSEDNSILSTSSTLKINGDDTPPYATIDTHNDSGNVANVTDVTKNSVKDSIISKPSNKKYSLDSTNSGPPLPPVRKTPVEDKSFRDSKSSHDDFSLFDEMAKQWDLHSSQIDSPSSVTDKSIHLYTDPIETIPESPEKPTQILTTSTVSATVKTDNYTKEIKLSTEKLTTAQSSTEKLIITQPSTEKLTTTQPSTEKLPTKTLVPVTKQTKESANTQHNHQKSNNFFSKLRSKKSTTSSKPTCSNTTNNDAINQSTVNKIDLDTKISSSPVYAKLQKSKNKKTDKPEKLDKSKSSKKNIISGPVLISKPMPMLETKMTEDNNIDDSFLDCTSEVSSLQPSPKESMVGLNQSPNSSDSSPPEQPSSSLNLHNSEHSNFFHYPTDSISRQNSHTLYTTSRNNKYSGSSTATTISPASSFASLGSIPLPVGNGNIALQGGAALRVLKKTDGVFRAPGLSSARRRPSGSGLNDPCSAEQDGALNNRSYRKASIPTSITMKYGNNGTGYSATLDRFANISGGSGNYGTGMREVIEDNGSRRDSYQESLDATTPVAMEFRTPPNIISDKKCISDNSPNDRIQSKYADHNFASSNIGYTNNNNNNQYSQNLVMKSTNLDRSNSNTSNDQFDPLKFTSHFTNIIKFNNEDDEVAL